MEQRDLKIGSYEGYVVLRTPETRIIRASHFSVQVEFHNMSSGKHFHNPFFASKPTSEILRTGELEKNFDFRELFTSNPIEVELVDR